MTATDTEIDAAALRAWIGRESVAADVITEDLAHKFHVTFSLPGDAPRLGDPAPGLIHFCLAPPLVATSALGPDGHPQKGGFLPPVPLPRRMWAGGRIDIARTVRVGDRLRRVSRIADVTVKAGRSGTLVFVSVEHSLDVEGEPAIREMQDIVYRGAGAGASTAVEAKEAERSPNREAVDASTTLLFRYSALTFNGHRIHYDRTYAQTAEGYPGLVVHGPLQATLLFLHAAKVGGQAPTKFSFQSRSPLFDGEPILLDAVAEGAGMTLWTSRPGGPIAMRAEAS